jgi:hypothetical protein
MWGVHVFLHFLMKYQGGGRLQQVCPSKWLTNNTVVVKLMTKQVLTILIHLPSPASSTGIATAAGLLILLAAVYFPKTYNYDKIK